MGYNSKSIKKDLDGKPIPQYFNPVEDEYEVLQGRNGANRVEIYGPDGNPISVVEDKLAVRASEIETILSVIAAEDFATEATLDEIKSYILSLLTQAATEDKQDALAALIGALTATAETDPAQSASQIALLKGILKQLQGDGEKPNVTQLTGSNMELYGATINDRPDADTVAAGTTFTIVDENLDQNWISDGTNWKEV